MFNSEIEVSYFAAGIAAHLASDENLDWSKVVMEKNQLISELVNAFGFLTARKAVQ